MLLQVGILVNKKSYPLSEYLEAAAITFGVAMFTFSEKSSKIANSRQQDTVFGILLLAIYILSDSFTSQWQSKVFKAYGIDQYQMMLGVNIWSIFFTSFALIYTGEGLTSIAFIMADSRALLHMVILSITSATGQLFIFYTIKEFGPVIFTIIMTTRQIFSLVLSCILFAHRMKALSWVGALVSFSIVFYRIYAGKKD